MKYLLDTCVISELSKKKPLKDLITWIKLKDESDLYLSVLTIGELYKGIAKLGEPKRKQSLLNWVESDLLKRFENRILGITDSVARKWGEIQGKAEQKGKKISVVDSLIAATGLVYELQIITRNTVDMEASGVNLFNPWDTQS